MRLVFLTKLELEPTPVAQCNETWRIKSSYWCYLRPWPLAQSELGDSWSGYFLHNNLHPNITIVDPTHPHAHTHTHTHTYMHILSLRAQQGLSCFDLFSFFVIETKQDFLKAKFCRVTAVTSLGTVYEIVLYNFFCFWTRTRGLCISFQWNTHVAHRCRGVDMAICWGTK